MREQDPSGLASLHGGNDAEVVEIEGERHTGMLVAGRWKSSLGSGLPRTPGGAEPPVPFDVESGLLGELMCVVPIFLPSLFICDPPTMIP